MVTDLQSRNQVLETQILHKNTDVQALQVRLPLGSIGNNGAHFLSHCEGFCVFVFVVFFVLSFLGTSSPEKCHPLREGCSPLPERGRASFTSVSRDNQDSTSI